MGISHGLQKTVREVTEVEVRLTHEANVENIEDAESFLGEIEAPQPTRRPHQMSSPSVTEEIVRLYTPVQHILRHTCTDSVLNQEVDLRIRSTSIETESRITPNRGHTA